MKKDVNKKDLEELKEIDKKLETLIAGLRGSEKDTEPIHQSVVKAIRDSSSKV